MAVITGTAFCDKNTWYSSNNPGYAPSNINDGVVGSRWIGAAVDVTASLQNFCGIKFTGNADVTEVRINFASWGRNIKIGTWAAGADPASASFTKANIIPIRSIDAFSSNDDDNVGMLVNTWLRFAISATQIPGIVIYCDDNGYSQLTNTSGTTNTNESINEVIISGTPPSGGPVKLPATGIASSQYNDFGSAASITDGNVGTGWSSAGVGAGAVADWVAVQLNAPTAVKKIELYIYSWGKTIVVGYTNTVPASKAGFTVVRTIDITVTPNDDLGVPWGRQKYNTILMPENTASALIWGAYTNDSAANILGIGGGALDRVRLMEFNAYSSGELVPAAPPGINPRAPATVPVVPFSGTAAGWVRSQEYATAGDFDFTPAIDTTLVLAVIQGAGSGGQILKNLDGSATSFGPTNEGGDSYIADATGKILSIGGGGKGIVAGVTDGPTTINANDWLRAQAFAGAIGQSIAVPQQAALAGAAQARLGGTAGATYALAGMTGPNLGNIDFTKDVSETLLPVNTSSNFSRNNTLGWFSTNVGMGGSVAFVEFLPIQLSAGQQVVFNYNTSSEVTDRLGIKVNGVQYVYIGGGVNSSYTYTASTAGSYTFRFEFSKDATVNQGLDRGAVTSIQVVNQQYPLQRSGASGANELHYLLAQPLKIRVGAAGLGVSGGQTVPAGAKGTRGAGGAAGADGGAGVVVIYEYKTPLAVEKPALPTFPNYNVTTAEPTGVYRTNYVGQGLGTKQSYSHKLRPRTKYVYVILVGCGGGTVQTYTGQSVAVPNDPTVVSVGAKTYTAGSGSSSYRTNSGGGQYPCQGGEGGVFTTNAETIYQKDGDGNRNNASQNTSGVVNSYGSSGGGTQGAGDGINNSAYPGGAGSVGMFVLSGDDIATGTIEIQVPGGGRAPPAGQYDVGNPGAVFVFETESGFGFSTTQTSELVLQKSGISATTVTQTAELVLQKSALGAIRTTQTSELILIKDTSVPDMQVANVYATLVYDAPPTGLNVTQTSELILQKNKIGGTAVTQTTEMVLQKTARSPYRLTQVSELFLVAETPTVFWLNFGTLDTPIRFQLYDSAIGRASSVPPNCKIQIEGFFAEGTHLVINGVASGVLADVKNNDRVYIHGGVTNYWQANMPVYAYYEQNGETARMLVGNWIIKQPVLIPKHTQAYYGSKVTPTWIQSRAGVGSLVTLQSIITKALMSLVQLTMTAVQNKFGSLVDLLQEKTAANSRIAEVTIGWDVTKALSKVSDSVSWIYTQALSTDVKNVVTWGTLKAQVSEYKQADFIAPKAKYGDVAIAYDVRTDGSTGYVTFTSEDYVLSVNYSHFTLDTTQTQAGYGDYVVKDFDKLNVGYGDVDQEYEYSNVDHSVTYEVVYVAVQSSSVARLFPMEPMGTIAYSVLTGMEWERSTAQGTGDWVIPTFSALNPQAKYGMFGAAGVDSNSGHSEYSQRETEVINGPQQGYFGTTSLWVQTYSVYAEREATVKRSEKTVAFDVTPIKTTAKTGVFNLTPFLAMQSVNGIGKASLYKGFDTKAEVDQFTENFSGVHTALKYNGYVYTLDVDKSFICEIFNNGPVKWLLQGG